MMTRADCRGFLKGLKLDVTFAYCCLEFFRIDCSSGTFPAPILLISPSNVISGKKSSFLKDGWEFWSLAAVRTLAGAICLEVYAGVSKID